MRMLFSFIKPYRLAMGIALTLMLIELTVELFQPLLIAKIIDDGILQENLQVVHLWGGILIGFSLLAFAAGTVNSFYSAHASQSIGFNVRERIYEKVQSLSLAQFDRFSNSSLITRMTNDVTQVQNALFMMLRIAMRAPLMVVGGVVMALLTSVKLTMMLIITVPLLLIFIGIIMQKVGPLFRKVQRKLDHINNIMQENLIGMRIIKAFLRKDYEIKRFTVSSGRLRERTVSALRLVELTMPAILLVMNLSIISILWFGDTQLDNGTASVGDVVAIVNYAIRITASLGMLSFIITSYARANASWERIVEVLDVEVEQQEVVPDDTAQVSYGHIAFEHVTFRYPNAHDDVLRRISFQVKAGQTVAILGATGSGKSTLFQLIPRLYEVGEGRITIDGLDIRSINEDELRNKIGYVPQEVLLFKGTVKENLMWGKETATMDEVIDAAQRAQIHDTIMKLPQQYETTIGQRGVNLSGGQKQRLSIARALIRRPVILLLDDSTSALDASTEAKLLGGLADYNCTTLLITQKMSAAMQADYILLLDEGKLIADGKHDDLLKHNTLYQKIYASQYGREAIHLAHGNN